MKIKTMLLTLMLMVGSITLTGCSSDEDINKMMADIISETILETVKGYVGTSDDTIIESSEFQTDVNSIAYNNLSGTQQLVYNGLVNGIYSFSTDITVKGSVDDVELAYNAVIADHPELFYTDGYVYNEKQSIIESDISTISVYPNYICTQSDYSELMTKIAASATEMIDSIDKDASEYEIAENVYKSILENVSYNKDVDASDKIVASFLRNAASCGGYANAYTYLLQQFGIPCTTVTGTVNGQSHNWNITIINEKMYLSDLTNGDSSLISADGSETDYINYGYFNMNPNFTTNYIADEPFSDITFDATEANYFVAHGTYIDSYSRDAISNVIKSAANSGTHQVTFSFASADLLKLAEGDLFTNRGIQLILGDTNVNFTENTTLYTLTILF